jgi:hypothetical protein
VRILFIAMSASVHVARWIAQLDGQGWDIHLFPSIDNGRTHPLLRDLTVHHSVYTRLPGTAPAVRARGLRLPFGGQPKTALAAGFGREILRSLTPDYRVRQLQRVIRRIQPDMVHVLEFQHAGYLALAARQGCTGRFPPLIVSSYGSDLYLYGRLAQHQERLRALLQAAAYFTCECERDIALARGLGFDGTVLGVLPNGGGLALATVEALRAVPPSQRRTIIIKGYQNVMGRALCALAALRLCADALAGYRVAIYSADADVQVAAELAAQDLKVPIDILPPLSHDELLRHFGAARVYIGLSISDAASTSMLEALAAGTFPIQSGTACTDEWFVDGETGFAVPPEDPHAVAQALRRALADDALVDSAAIRNAQVCAARLDSVTIRTQTIALYERVLKENNQL